MAAFHFQVRSPISRKKGQSAVAKAAYNAREMLTDERTGERKDYSRNKHEVLFSGIFIDPSRQAPEWAQNRGVLWNAAVAAEKRKDAREAQEIIVGLPHELTDKQRENMLKDFVRENLTRGTGRVADVAIHRPPQKGDDRNYHAHILLTLREIGPDGFGKRMPEMAPQDIVRLRTKWAERAAKELRKAGHELEAERWAVGHKTQEQQQEAALRRGDLVYAAELKRTPSKHRGPGATAMERKGIVTERGEAERRTKAGDMELAKLERELVSVKREIRVLQKDRSPKPDVKETFRQAAKATSGQRVGREDQRMGAIAGRGMNKGVSVAASTLNVLGNALESLFAPPRPKSSEQVKQEARAADRAGKEQQIEWEQFVHASDHERRAAHIAEQEQQKQREREGRERLERERGGRER